MADNNSGNRGTGAIGLMLGGVVAIVTLMFFLSGGQLGGVKHVNGDADMPPVATGKR
jgi:hypothetical protein